MGDQYIQGRSQLIQRRLLQRLRIHPRQKLLTALQHLRQQIHLDPLERLRLLHAVPAPQLLFAVPPPPHRSFHDIQRRADRRRIAVALLKLIQRPNLRLQTISRHPNFPFPYKINKRREDPHSLPSG